MHLNFQSKYINLVSTLEADNFNIFKYSKSDYEIGKIIHTISAKKGVYCVIPEFFSVFKNMKIKMWNSVSLRVGRVFCIFAAELEG